MSLKFKRFEAPPPGQTLLLDKGAVWKDPRKPENAPLPVLESEKGLKMPVWGQIISLAGVLAVFTTVNHYRLIGKW